MESILFASLSEIKFSLIVPIYKVEKYLDQCISSIVKQTLDFKTHVELILVNDGSPDNCDEICKKWQQLYPENIKYIYKENGGVSSARNIGLEHASYEWISFPDPDDWLENTYLEKVSKAILENNNIDMIVCSMLANNGHYFISYENVISNISYDKILYRLYVNSTFFRKSIISKNNIRYETNHILCQDFTFSLSYILCSNMNYYKLSANYIYRRLENSASKNLSLDKVYYTVTNGFYSLFKKLQSDKFNHVRKPILLNMAEVLLWMMRDINGNIDNHKKTHFLKCIREIGLEVSSYINAVPSGLLLSDLSKMIFLKMCKISTTGLRFIDITNYNNNTITFKHQHVENENLELWAFNKKLNIISKKEVFQCVLGDYLHKETYYKVSIKNVNPYCCLSVIDNEGKYLDIRINHANVMSNGLYSIANIIKHLNNNHKHKTPAIQNTMYIKETYKNYILFSKYKYKDIKHSMILKYKLLGFITLFKKYISYHDGKKTKKYVFFNLFTICK